MTRAMFSLIDTGLESFTIRLDDLPFDGMKPITEIEFQWRKDGGAWSAWTPFGGVRTRQLQPGRAERPWHD